MVHRRGVKDQARRLRPRKGHHGHPSLRLRHMGEHPARTRQALQRDGARKRLLSHANSHELPHQGEGACRGLRPRSRRGNSRGRRRARRAPRHPSHFRNYNRQHVFQMASVLPRPAHTHQPVGKRNALGKDHPPVFAHLRVLVAGGSHRARHRGGGARRDQKDARRI